MKFLALGLLLVFSEMTFAADVEVLEGKIQASKSICPATIVLLDGTLDCGRFDFVSGDLQERVASSLENAGLLILVGKHEVVNGKAYFMISSVALQKE